ncbi:hypothetical protein B0O99DRAFT_742062 [Bisporella sp. PMI_857]|nr:hypothetical protein B0O99DRAFT_742062 [Bisporella sp. PMI_857]
MKAIITDLARTLRSEDYTLNIVTFDLDPKTENPFDMAQKIYEVFDQVFQLHARTNTSDNSNMLFEMTSSASELALGSLDQPERSLWLEIQTPGIGTVVEVGNAMNGEFKVSDRVCAIHLDGMATMSNIDYHRVQRIPDGMPLEIAAAILISYATALYALRDVAHVTKGDSILIHAVAGALGQAAIAIAQYF